MSTARSPRLPADPQRWPEDDLIRALIRAYLNDDTPRAARCEDELDRRDNEIARIRIERLNTMEFGPHRTIRDGLPSQLRELAMAQGARAAAVGWVCPYDPGSESQTRRGMALWWLYGHYRAGK